MSTWDGSGDQYHSDIDPRYPLFSDVQTDDYSLAVSHRPIMPREVNSLEAKYLYESQDMPAQLRCKCGSCPMREWPRGVPPMRRMNVENREALAQQQYAALYGKRSNLGHMLASNADLQPCVVGGAVNGAVNGANLTQQDRNMILLPGDIKMDVNTFVLLFIFIVFVFLCYCMKSINDVMSKLDKKMNK